MCLERVYSPLRAFPIRLLLLVRPYLYKAVSEGVDHKGERAWMPTVKRSYQLGSDLIRRYNKTEWNLEEDMRPSNDSGEFQGFLLWKGHILPELESLGYRYPVGFHCSLFRKPARRWVAYDNLVKKVKFRDIRAMGSQRGISIVVGAIKFKEE